MDKSIFVLVILVSFLLLSTLVSAQFKFIPLDIISNFFNSILKIFRVTTTSQKTIPSSGSIVYPAQSLVIKRYTANEYGRFDTDATTYAGLYDMTQADRATNVINGIAAVHQIRPDFKALLYWNMRSVETRYSDVYNTCLNNGWLLNDSSGNLITCDVPGAYIVDVGSPDYQAYIASYLSSSIVAVGYDGVFADNSLFYGCELFWGTSSTPINPRTGKAWNDTECRQALINLQKALKNALGSRPLECNGIYQGDRYYQHQSEYNQYLTSSPLDGERLREHGIDTQTVRAPGRANNHG